MINVGGGVIDPSVAKIKYTVNVERKVYKDRTFYREVQLNGYYGWWDVVNIPPGQYKFTCILPKRASPISENFTIVDGKIRYDTNHTWMRRIMPTLPTRVDRPTGYFLYYPSDVETTITNLDTHKEVKFKAEFRINEISSS